MSRTAMLAWHNSPALKAEVSARMLQHRIEDGIIQGTYQTFAPELASQYKGCLIGCTLPMGEVMPVHRCPCGCGDTVQPSILLRHDWHKEVERFYGIPEVLNHVFDHLFESLPQRLAAWFAVSTIEAIPVGADLSGVADLFDQDLVEMAKRSRKKVFGYERGYSEWLNFRLRNLLAQYSQPVARKKVEILAEKLLAHLANAPVPNAPVKEDAAERLLDEILNDKPEETHV